MNRPDHFDAADPVRCLCGAVERQPGDFKLCDHCDRVVCPSCLNVQYHACPICLTDLEDKARESYYDDDRAVPFAANH